MKSKIDTLVLSGGGIKGVAYCGVFKKLQEIQKDETNNIDINIKKLCCVSVGSIFGLTFVLGYEYPEMHDEVMEKNFEYLKDIRVVNILSKYGIDSGRNIIAWLDTLIIKKGYHKGITMKELYDKTGIHFQVLATNLNKYKYTIFDHINTPDVKVTKAIRMSIGIPFMFSIETHENDIHVDGGLINNYPIELFEDCLETVLGVKLVSHGELSSHIVDERIREIDSYVFHVVSCFIVQKEKHTSLSQTFRDHTIYIHTEGVTHTINFSLTEAEKLRLIEIGYNTTDVYFRNLVSS
jgi:NTE family protein